MTVSNTPGKRKRSEISTTEEEENASVAGSASSTVAAMAPTPRSSRSTSNTPAKPLTTPKSQQQQKKEQSQPQESSSTAMDVVESPIAPTEDTVATTTTPSTPYVLAIVESYVTKKHKSYRCFPLPTTLEVTPDKEKWFSFASKADYYPIGIFSTTDMKLQQPTKTPGLQGTMVTLTISLLKPSKEVDETKNRRKSRSSSSASSSHDERYPPYSNAAPAMEHIYWYSTIRAHVSGVIELRFSVEGRDDIAPLVHHITVSGGEQEEETVEEQVQEEEEEEVAEEEELEEEVVKEVKKKSTTKKPTTTPAKSKGKATKKQEEEVGEGMEVEMEEEVATTPVVTTTSAKKQKASKQSGIKVKKETISTAIKVEEVAEELPPPPSKIERHPFDVAIPMEEIAHTYWQEVRCEPVFGIPMLAKNRLEPLCSGSSSSGHHSLQGLGTQSNHNLLMKGPLFSILISPNLLHLLHHDRFDLYPRLVEHMRTHLLPALTPPATTTKSSKKDSSSSVAVRTSGIHPWLSEENGQWMNEVMNNMMRPTVFDLLAEFPGRLQSAQIHNHQKIIDTMRYMFDTMLESHILYPEEREVFAPVLEFIRNRKISSAMFFGPYYLLRFVVVLTMAVQSTTNTEFVAGNTQRVKGAFSDLEKMLEQTIRHLDDISTKVFY